MLTVPRAGGLWASLLASIMAASMLAALPAGASGHPPDPIPRDDFDIPDDQELPTGPIDRAGIATVDVAVVYTKGLRAGLGSKAAVEAMIASGVIFTNHALAASETKVQLRLVAVKKVKYSSTGISGVDLNNLIGSSALAEARALRVKKGADLVMLLTEVNYGGVAQMVGPYSVVGYAGDYTPIIMAHEWGHNFGAGHDAPVGCWQDACGYDAPDGSFRDLMSYGVKCGGCPRVPFFSNPDVKFSWAKVPVHAGNEVAQGIELDYVFGPLANMADASASAKKVGKVGKANNARAIRYYGPLVAGRSSQVVPNGPTCMGLPATWVGTDGPDVFVGTKKRDVVVAGGGDDEIHGGGGSDVICGGAGSDQIFGGDGDDFLYGEGGYDTIDGGPGDDFIDGGGGNDHLTGGDGSDVISGGGGHDILLGGLGNDHLDGGKGNDTLAGGAGSNRLVGRAGNDLIEASGSGDFFQNDYIQPGAGNDTVIGNASVHVLSFEDATDGPLTADLSSAGDPVTADLLNGTGTTSLVGLRLAMLIGSRTHDVISVVGWISVRGLAGNDLITGELDIFGDAGDDTLNGSPSWSYVDGGKGYDQCTGYSVVACEA